MEEVTIKCGCGHASHRITFSYDEDWKFFYVTYFLDTFTTVWQRLYYAFRYIFFGELICMGDIHLEKEEVLKLKEWLNERC
jgi:hypothetical protein